MSVNYNLDKQFRAIFSNTYIALEQLEKGKESFLTEDLRYDILSILRYIEVFFKYNKDKTILHNFEKWREKVKNGHDFYKLLISKNNKDASYSLYLKEIFKSRFYLRDFTYSNFTDSYTFWSKQKELWQALYTIETILSQEAGRLDGKEALERKDIVQLILNRYKVPFYNSFAHDDAFYPYLKKIYSKDEEFQKNKWINILFKEGEFSFTYYFVPTSIQMYCPANTSMANFLRKENLTIALEMLKAPKNNFPVLRFFSRISMLGRMDMAPLWRSEYVEIPERAGNEIITSDATKDSDLNNLNNNDLITTSTEDVRKARYKFLYMIRNEQGNFFVAEFKNQSKQGKKDKNKILVFKEDGKNIRFYNYRNPQLFRFFKERMPMGIGKGITHFASSANVAPASAVELNLKYNKANSDTINTSANSTNIANTTDVSELSGLEEYLGR
ncbi:MAG: hypothetical protein HQK51_19470 [Oligoflexia bacterium]|nr:hypothetical protein [Oligoflexia bacterium]